MGKISLKWGYTAVVLLLAIACNNTAETENQESAPRSKSGETLIKKSELAVLMRNMYNELDSLKPMIQSGQFKAVDLLGKYHKIDVATPTDSADSGPVFESFAAGFKERLNLLDLYPDSTQLWNAMISSCVDCHKSYCPGPVKTINKLKV
jgi:hypothetical protein